MCGCTSASTRSALRYGFFTPHPRDCRTRDPTRSTLSGSVSVMPLGRLLALVAPPLCVACGSSCRVHDPLCGDCRRQLRWLGGGPPAGRGPGGGGGSYQGPAPAPGRPPEVG